MIFDDAAQQPSRPHCDAMTQIKPMLSLCRLARLCVLGLALQTHAANAQTPGNPAINAQLLVGARQNDLAQVERVLAQGAAPNSRNRLGKTALLIAAEKGNLALATRMLSVGADVNLASLERVTPLMAASYSGQAALVKLLLDAGAQTAPVDSPSFPSAK